LNEDGASDGTAAGGWSCNLRRRGLGEVLAIVVATTGIASDSASFGGGVTEEGCGNESVTDTFAMFNDLSTFDALFVSSFAFRGLRALSFVGCYPNVQKGGKGPK